MKGEETKAYISGLGTLLHVVGVKKTDEEEKWSWEVVRSWLVCKVSRREWTSDGCCSKVIMR